MPITVVASEPPHLATSRLATQRGRTRDIAQVLSLAPLVMLVAVAIAADPSPSLLGPLQPEPQVLGMPAGAILAGLVLGWAAMGALAVRCARSPLVESLALLAFTIPATFAAVLVRAIPFLVPPG